MWKLIYSLTIIKLATASLSLCSTQNTGISSTLSTSLYMSNGLCKDTCNDGGYAFAIVNGESCYCSNTSPGSTVDLSDCSSACPGYPYEQCGGDSYFGYIQLKEASSVANDNTQSSTKVTEPQETSIEVNDDTTTQQATEEATTKSAATEKATTQETTKQDDTSTQQTSTQAATTSVNQQEQEQQQQAETTSTRSTTTSSSHTTSSSSSTTLVAWKTTTLSASASTLTASGSKVVMTSYITSIATEVSSHTQVITLRTTVMVVPTTTQEPSSSATSVSDTNKSTSNSFFDSKGKVAGVFTVVGVVVVGVVATLVYCCCFAYTHHNEDEDVESQVTPYTKNGGIITTNRSIDSSDTDGGNGHLRQVSLVSTDFGTPIIDRKGDSTYVDQRLDVHQFDEQEEMASLNDGEDYSRRVWKVTNL